MEIFAGAFPSLDGFLAATGCAGAGIAMSGGIGRLVAELAMDWPPFVDAAPHRIDRFGEIDPFDPHFCSAVQMPGQVKLQVEKGKR